MSLILGFSDYQLLTTIISRTIAITEFSVQEYALNMFMKLARRYFIRQVVVEVVIFRDYGQRESKPLMCTVKTGYGC